MSSYLLGPDQPPRPAPPASPDLEAAKDSGEPTIITATLVTPSDDKPSRSAAPSLLESFLSNFLREENIKWMSIIGAAIVLASSLMLVTRQWATWSTELKYFTILAYTVATYYSGRLARTRLGLTTSGRVMELLSLLLLPLCFIALGWLDKAAYSGMPLFEKFLLVVPALGLTWHAASRIFNDILRGPQPTFLISYLVLAAAGALPAMPGPWIAITFVGAAWVVTSLGVLKVNRHIFWLTEETKQPRVFAFLPVALLGSMFVTLVATKALPMIAISGLGTVCVLFAGTILLTARAAADVFKQRTGNLVRPLPWSLMAPLVIGLVLIAAGVMLSCHGFSFRGATTVAIIPTSLLAAGLLCVVAWDTGVAGFVWPALGMLTMAYQVSPILFRSAILQLRDSAAAVMNEPTLPLAFYGITYTPLIALLIAAAACCLRCQGPNNLRWQVFARPTRHFATGLMVILFVSALTNLKALAIVSAIDVVIWLVMAIALRERLFAWSALAKVVLCSVLLFPFGHALGWWDRAINEIPTSVAGLGLLLALIPGLDRWLALIPSRMDRRTGLNNDGQTQPLPVCITLGYCLAFTAALAWAMISVFEFPAISTQFTIQWILIGTTFLMATVRTRDYLAALGFWSVTAIGWAILAATWTMDVSLWTSSLAVGCAALTLGLLFVLRRYKHILGVDSWRAIRMNSILLKPVTDLPSLATGHGNSNHVGNGDGGWVQLLATLSVALRDLSLAIALCLAAIVVIPMTLALNVGLPSVISPLTILVMATWGGCMTCLHRSLPGAFAMGIVTPLVAAALLFGYLPSHHTLENKVLVWAIISSLTLLLSSIGRPQWLRPTWIVSQVWLMALGTFSLTITDPIFRIVGLIAAGTILLHHWRSTNRYQLTLAAIFLNVQLLMLVMYFAGVEGYVYQWILDPQLNVAGAMLLPALAISTLVFQYRRLALDTDCTAFWTILLRIISIVIAVSVASYGKAMLPWVPVVLAGIALFALGEFVRAKRTQQERFVWSGMGILAVSVLWLASLGIIELGVGASQLVLAIAAAGGLLLHRLLQEKSTWEVFARPMFTIGMVCPGILTALAVQHQLVSRQRMVDPIGTLTMFAAAFIYFHQAYVLKSRKLLLLSIAIVNIAILLTWYSLGLQDAQFYCVPVGLSVIALVQLLGRDLPRKTHDPLRYIGALIVLVSPLFEIIDGSWIHLASLLVLCVVVVLLAIGLRLRALLNVGTAFLLGDLVMMVVRSSIDHPSLLWISGLGIGAAVIVLAAICERHREQVLSRIRMLSAELATWN